LWLFKRELHHAGLPPKALDAAYAGIFGGLIGAKLWWVAEHSGQEPLVDLLLSRGGMSWFGGFAGGLLSGLFVFRIQKLPIITTLAAAAPALAIGHGIGRIGCFLVGDDYGSPSTLPWAVAFPEGLPPIDIPVHPTQIYEAVPLFLIGFLLIRWRSQGVSDRTVLGRYLVLVGALRFAIEFVRINVRIVGPFTVAHIASVAAALAGLALLASADGASRRLGLNERQR
jgi:phosphatidylglycerol---prolipoprotein diacylglyceryl transferase